MQGEPIGISNLSGPICLLCDYKDSLYMSRIVAEKDNSIFYE